MIRSLTNFKTAKIIHGVLWVIWALLVLTFYDERSGACYDALFGRYLSFRAFSWFELLFMFGGGWLLLALFLRVFNRYVAYILFELIFIGIIAVHLRIWFCK